MGERFYEGYLANGPGGMIEEQGGERQEQTSSIGFKGYCLSNGPHSGTVTCIMTSSPWDERKSGGGGAQKEKKGPVPFVNVCLKLQLDQSQRGINRQQAGGRWGGVREVAVQRWKNN